MGQTGGRFSRAARAVSRERIEDYVAAAASVDGALAPIDDEERGYYATRRSERMRWGVRRLAIPAASVP